MAAKAKALRLPAKLTRKQTDAIAAELKADYAVSIMGWCRREGDGLVGGVAKKLGASAAPALTERLGLEEGDLMLIRCQTARVRVLTQATQAYLGG